MKVTLRDVTVGQGSLEIINANTTAIEEAFENTLSRDGTAPNQMDALLDMNSNQIINLPWASSDGEPMTLGQFNGLTEPPITYTPNPHTHNWADINNTPASYPPSSHVHTITEVTDLQAYLTSLSNSIVALEAGPTIFVQSAEPTTQVTNDLWFW